MSTPFSLPHCPSNCFSPPPQCTAAGRDDDKTNEVPIASNIVQTGSNPLFVMDGIL